MAHLKPHEMIDDIETIAAMMNGNLVKCEIVNGKIYVPVDGTAMTGCPPYLIYTTRNGAIFVMTEVKFKDGIVQSYGYASSVGGREKRI